MLNKGAPTLLPTAQEPPHAQCARTGRPSPDREMLGSSQGQAHRAGRAMLELCLRCIWQRRPEVFPHCQGQSMIALWCVRIPPDCSWQRRPSGAKSSISRSVPRLGVALVMEVQVLSYAMTGSQQHWLPRPRPAPRRAGARMACSRISRPPGSYRVQLRRERVSFRCSAHGVGGRVAVFYGDYGTAGPVDACWLGVTVSFIGIGCSPLNPW
jgi:hypothetical protein